MALPAAVTAALAAPREAGTPAATAARQALADHLAGLGYGVEVQPFSFSPATLNAFPVLGAGIGWLALLSVPLLLLPGAPRGAALLVLAGGLVALALLTRGLALGWAGSRSGLREDANLIVRRPGVPVRRWIVAHIDTKAQGHSMAGRLVAVWVTMLAVAALIALAGVRLGGPPPPPLVAGAAGLALAAGVLAGRGRLRGSSPGARDNASGVIAVLAAAEAAEPASGVGVLLTGAEEFGLVGARILAQTRPELVRGIEVVNLDTIDEQGPVWLVSHDGPGHAFAEALAPGLAVPGAVVRRRRLPLGIFVDSHPLAQAGGRAVTVARLDWATLRLLHTPRDTGIDFSSAETLGRQVVRSN